MAYEREPRTASLHQCVILNRYNCFLKESALTSIDPLNHFTAAIGRRFDSAFLVSGEVKVEGIDVEFPDVPRVPSTGAPLPLFPRLARDHPWDIGELAFSTVFGGP